MDIKQIIEQNYKATVKRGLITVLTDFYDFHSKLLEEVQELEYSKLPFG